MRKAGRCQPIAADRLIPLTFCPKTPLIGRHHGRRSRTERRGEYLMGNTMHNVKIAVGLIVLALSPTGSVLAQSSTFSAQAEILDAIQLTKDADLAFGKIVADPVSGFDVTVDTTGAQNCPVGQVCFGTSTAAAFTVSGTGDNNYAVTLPVAAAITHATSSSTMLVKDFVTSLTNDRGQLTAGSDSFTLGATLEIAAAQEPGAYSGTFNVSVDYE